MADISKIKLPDNTTYNVKDANAVTGSGTSGYLTKFNGSKSVTNGPALGSDTTKFLRNDGTWAVPPGTSSGGNKIFTTTPTPPYSVGDLWVVDDNNVDVCTTARASGSYDEDDWGSAVSGVDSQLVKGAISDAITVVTGNGEDGGNIILKLTEDEDRIPYELLVTNTPDLTGKVYKWDGNGLHFSSNGYNGTYSTIINSDGQIPTQFITGPIDAAVNTINNFTADMVHGGKLVRGYTNNSKGTIELQDTAGTVIAEVTNEGFKFYGQGSGEYRPYYLINTNGFVGYIYDPNHNPVQTIKVAFDEFRMTKGYVRDELDIGGQIKIVPIDNGTNAGISFVASV